MDALAVIRRHHCAAAVFLLFLSAPSLAFAQLAENLPPGARHLLPLGSEVTPGESSAPSLSPMQLPDLTKKENFSSAMQIIILLTVLSLAPAILIMMTSFTRIIIVLSLLRQALGTQQLPPNQVLIGLSMFMTFLVMAPTWQRVNSEALQPYMDGSMPQRDALALAQVPVREFMLGQIVKSGNEEDIYLFHEFAQNDEPADGAAPTLTSPDAEIHPEHVSTMTLIPAFMISELKTAFLLGFKVYLPFLIIDMVISSVLISMGMMMLPPVLISLPFKLLLFVLVDGWRLIVEGLMGSFL
jgi:flagellar biosynthesis protein FliP